MKTSSTTIQIYEALESLSNRQLNKLKKELLKTYQKNKKQNSLILHQIEIIEQKRQRIK